MVHLEGMWKLVVFVWLSGSPVNWTTPPNFYTEDQCVSYSTQLESDITQAIETNGLNLKEGFIISSWCVQTNPKETKL